MTFEGKQVNIPVKGIIRAGTDNLCADGAMNEVIGMEYKDGSWLPYKEKSTTVFVNKTEDETDYPLSINKTWIHKVSDDAAHHIFLSGTDLYYEDSRTGNTIHATYITGNVKDIEFVGNMLNVATTTGLEHYIWGDGVYTEQKAELPKVYFRTTAGFVSGVDRVEGITHVSHGSVTGTEMAVSPLYSGVISALGETRDRGGLTGYSLACYAFRLKNGEFISASPLYLVSRPVTLNGDYESGFCEVKPESYDRNFGTDETPLQFYTQGANGSHGSKHAIFPFDVTANNGYGGIGNAFDDGFYTIKLHEGKCFIGSEKYGWKKFLCPMTKNGGSFLLHSECYAPTLISTLQENGYSENGSFTPTNWIYYTFAAGNSLQYKIEGLENIDESLISSVCIFLSQEVSPYEIKEEKYMRYLYGDNIMWGSGSLFVSSVVPRKKESEIIKELIQQKNFYLVEEKSIVSLKEQLSTQDSEWSTVELKDKLGDKLVVLEQLPLSSFVRDETIPDFISAYNYRLHAYDYTQKLFRGYQYTEFFYHGGEGQFQKQTFQHVFNEGEANEYTRVYKWEIKVTLKGDSGESVVVNYNNTEAESLVKSLSPVIIYPNADAESITIRIYAYDSRTNQLGQGLSQMTSQIYDESYEATFVFRHDYIYGISYYIDPELKPIIPQIMQEELAQSL